MASVVRRHRSRSRSPARNRGNRDDRGNERERDRRRQHRDKHQETRNNRVDRRSRHQDTSHGSTSTRRREWDRDKDHSEKAPEAFHPERRYHNRRHERQHSPTEPQASVEDSGGQDGSLEPDGPNYNLSGKLTEYSNTYKGVVIKYNEPAEARKPRTRWRLYPFKGEEAMSVMHIHRQSAYLIGRQRHIVDIAVDHPSCSKQHAVLQYRLVDYERPDGTSSKKVKPYIIDLESANGTFLNNQKIEPRRFYELKEKDVLKFGFSTREYVILTEKSQVEDDEDEDPAE
ncbi:smad nuclear-interacting protein 1-like [Stylophora pistillata]|uniref:Smad nuclear-interacting protein 1 n=1 Tax=Stylophora pistillata TaxID=50429 RepID=A0A2B4SLG0_STYPI|nr:smad nuclear-interacting protein 1-like [Stylophora pistillata]PFX29255.1 Smad nuclear-interacting protein 1 [Stylophora pistillata]